MANKNFLEQVFTVEMRRATCGGTVGFTRAVT